MNNLNYFEYSISHWAWGHTRSEQMCAHFLTLEGYEEVEPQAPHGGPDGGKDIVFAHALGKGIAACYFPQSPSSISEIKKKFNSDLRKAKKNGVKCFIFFTGQRVTLIQRTEMVKNAGVPVYFIEQSSLLARYKDILDFIGESNLNCSNENINSKRKSDINCLKSIIYGCAFFELKEGVDRAPYRFGPSIIDKDNLNYLFECEKIFFYDVRLNELFAKWWENWSAILNLIRWNFDMVPGGDAYLPKDHHMYSENMYLSEISSVSADFSNAHTNLLAYAREKYPEVFAE